MTQILRFIISVSLIGIICSEPILGNDHPNGMKTDDAKVEKNKDTKDKIEKEKLDEPDTLSPQKKTIRKTLTLKGYIEDLDAISLSVSTQNWTDLKVISPPVHGLEVKKNEVVLKLDTEKILKNLQMLSYELKILDFNKEILQEEIKLAEELEPLEKEKIDQLENYAKVDYKRYKEIYLPFDKRSASMSLKRNEENLAYAAEELNQLKKMYEADDLTEETEEIILQRAQNQYDQAKFSLEAAKIRNEELMQIRFPRDQTAIDTNFNRDKLSIKTMRKIKPVELNLQKLEGKKISEERKQFAINKEKLEKDLKLMQTVKTPVSGVLYWGTFERGKWSGTSSFKTKLRKGGMLKSHEEFVTICPGKNFRARFNLPEKHLHKIKAGHDASISMISSEDTEINCSIDSVSRTPVQPGTFDVIAKISLPDGFLEPVPGAECTLERVTYHKLGAITLPDSVIHEEDHDSDKKYIYFLNKNGKSIKRFIKIGEKTGDLVEIISGVKMNMKVLRNKPSK
jgi:HlyD family secretion protein